MNKFKKLLLILFFLLIPFSLDLNINSSPSLTMNIGYALEIGECDGFDTGTYSNCIANGILSIYELIIFYTTQILLVIIGLIFDAFLFFSMDSNFYRSGMIEAGWEILRDFTNIVFIFALLTIAFKLVLNQDDGKTRGTLIKTILVALTINFSLFITYFVIDASNLLAHVFYNRIEATGSYETTNGDTDSPITEWVKGLTEGQKSVSLAVASKVNPQRIITTSQANGSELTFIQGFIIVTSAGLMNILMGYIFITLMLLFVGRSIGLMVSGIIAPVAFATLTIPSAQNVSYVGFRNWLNELIKLAFMAPVFMFFMYIIVQFLGNDGVIASITRTPPGNSSAGFLILIMQTYMLFFILGGLLLLAKKITTDMAGNLGSMAVKGVSGLTAALAGGAALAVTGGAAALGGVSRLAGAGATAAGYRSTGDKLKSFGKTTMAFKADVTKLPGFNTLANQSGVKGLGGMIGKVTGKSGLDADLAARTGVKGAIIGANEIRQGVSDIASGRDTKAVADYSEKLQESRDSLSKNRVENVQRTGRYESSGINPETGKDYTSAEIAAIQVAGKDEYGNINPTTGKPYTKTENAKRLKDNRDTEKTLKAQLSTQTTGERKIEQQRAQEAKDNIQNDINTQESEKSQANKQIGDITKALQNHKDKTSELQSKAQEASQNLADLQAAPKPKDKDKAAERDLEIKKAQRDLAKAVKEVGEHTSGKGSVATLNANMKTATAKRDGAVKQIEKLKKDKDEVDETYTTEGKLKKVQKDIDKQLQDARSWLLKEDERTQWTLQDSNAIAFDKTERKNRVQTQQSRFGDGSIKSTPTPGGGKKDSKK